MSNEDISFDDVPYCTNCNYINDSGEQCFNCGCREVGYLINELEGY